MRYDKDLKGNNIGNEEDEGQIKKERKNMKEI